MTARTAAITCPRCGHRAVETMPEDACQYFYDCRGCGDVLKPKPGDCCVFCSYADRPCPPVQMARETGGQATCCG
jgi:hypothetical protein